MVDFLLFASILFLGIGFCQTVSIQYVSAYYSQRQCAWSCQAIYADYPPVHVAQDLSCESYPIQNSCFCRADLQSEAENYIRTCVEKRCGNTLDANDAVSIYDAYCTSAGFVKAAATIGMAYFPLQYPEAVVVYSMDVVIFEFGKIQFSNPLKVWEKIAGTRSWLTCFIAASTTEGNAIGPSPTSSTVLMLFHYANAIYHYLTNT